MAKYRTTKEKVISNFKNNLAQNMKHFDRAIATHFNQLSYVVSNP